MPRLPTTPRKSDAALIRRSKELRDEADKLKAQSASLKRAIEENQRASLEVQRRLKSSARGSDQKG